MDPQVTWQLLLDAYADQEWQDVQEAADALLAWLDRGGFPPHTMSGYTLGPAWDQALCRAACRFALDEVRKQDG